ncbi:hypothetical protein YC2023_072781 [Brassica napus]
MNGREINYKTYTSFKTGIIYDCLMEQCPDVSWHASFHMWLVIQNRIPTRDRLIQRGLQVDNRCLLCNRNQETIDHLFFSCDFSYDLWKLVARRLEILPNKNWADYTRTNNFPLIADTAKTTCPSYLAGDGILDLE